MPSLIRSTAMLILFSERAAIARMGELQALPPDAELRALNLRPYYR